MTSKGDLWEKRLLLMLLAQKTICREVSPGCIAVHCAVVLKWSLWIVWVTFLIAFIDSLISILFPTPKHPFALLGVLIFTGYQVWDMQVENSDCQPYIPSYSHSKMDFTVVWHCRQRRHGKLMNPFMCMKKASIVSKDLSLMHKQEKRKSFLSALLDKTSAVRHWAATWRPAPPLVAILWLQQCLKDDVSCVASWGLSGQNKWSKHARRH